MLGEPVAKNILVVEDERLIARELQESLSALGYAVPGIAATADEAISQASESCPDLVLMDIHIRGALDGVATAEILRRRFDVPVVYLTAYADPDTVARASRTEPYGYLIKPVTDDALRSAVDIALYKHAVERAVRRRERWFSTTLRSIGDGVISTDLSGSVTFMNPVAESLTGWGAEAAVGRPVSDVLKLGDQPISDKTAAILDERGEVLGAVIVLRDLSEQRRLERQLELADRLASLGTLAAGVAHEINNPMAVVLANLEFVLGELRASGGALGESRAKDLEQAVLDAAAAGKRVTKVVGDLHAFARPGQSRGEVADVRPVIEWARRIVSHDLDPKAEVKLELDEVPQVSADEVRLGQVFLNLLVNAGEAIDPGARERNRVTVRARDGAEGVVVEVSDTGRGMTPEVAARAFDPFFSTKETGKGTGLGLSICHGIVASVGGRIEVESAPGQGSTFRVTLPRARVAVPKAAPPPPAPVRAHVLVVDDEPLLRTAFRRVLSTAHEVTAVDSGAAALAVLRAGERFDVIFCDLMMPGMNGMDLHAEVLALDPEQVRRMVFVSGGAYSPVVADFLETVPNPYVEKPFDPALLNDQVSRMVASLGTIAPR